MFTDMLALLGLAMVALGLARERPWLVCLGTAVATLTRQYLAFIVPAVILADVWASFAGRGLMFGRASVAAALGLCPLGALVLLWGGHLAPDNALRDVYLSDGLRFDWHALSLYLAIPGFYLAPLVLRWLKSSRAPVWLAAALVASLVLWFPVAPSIAQIREGSEAVGFVHQALMRILPPTGVSLLFWVAATCSLVAFWEALESARSRWRQALPTVGDLFPWIGCASFLVVMPFSYMPWEKYALPLFMLGIVCLVDGGRPDPMRRGESARHSGR